MSVGGVLAFLVVILIVIVALAIDSLIIATIFLINYAIAKYVALPIIYWVLSLFHVSLGLESNLLAALIAVIQMLSLGIRGLTSKVKEKGIRKEGQGYIM